MAYGFICVGTVIAKEENCDQSADGGSNWTYREPKSKGKGVTDEESISFEFVVALVLVFGIGSVLAADRKRDRKRDGSCRSSYSIESSELTLAPTERKIESGMAAVGASSTLPMKTRSPSLRIKSVTVSVMAAVAARIDKSVSRRLTQTQEC